MKKILLGIVAVLPMFANAAPEDGVYQCDIDDYKVVGGENIYQHSFRNEGTVVVRGNKVSMSGIIFNETGTLTEEKDGNAANGMSDSEGFAYFMRWVKHDNEYHFIAQSDDLNSLDILVNCKKVKG